jgi:hypothetical protein
MTDKKLNIDDLIESVDNDSDNSITKKAATLLITAMNDWPTFNQTDLFDFLQEFRKDYGEGLTIEKLRTKKTAEAWKEEAKASIIEMLELDRAKDFNKMIEEILNKYNNKK